MHFFGSGRANGYSLDLLPILGKDRVKVGNTETILVSRVY